MANQRNLTKFTVQEALNKEHYTAYEAVYGDPGDMSTAALVSTQTFSASTGSTSIFSETDDQGRKLVYSKVSLECDEDVTIQLADKNGTLGAILYFDLAHLPVTFTGYDITDIKLGVESNAANIGIIAWR